MKIKILQKITKYLSIFSLMILVSGCHSYSTSLNEMESLNMAEIQDIKKGRACSYNLFGAFKLPYFGDTAIRLSGEESVIDALKAGNIQNVYAVDKEVRNYILYSRRCTIAFGH